MYDKAAQGSRQMSPLRTDAHWSVNPKTRMADEEIVLDSREEKNASEPPHRSSNASVISVQNKGQGANLGDMTLSSEVQVEVSIEPTESEILFLEHEMNMQKLRAKQNEQALNDSQFSKPPISFSGQNDISNSVWVDSDHYSRKKRPNILMKDLDTRTRNGKVEMGQSPFDKQEFIRMDGKTARLTNRGAFSPKLPARGAGLRGSNDKKDSIFKKDLDGLDLDSQLAKLYK